MSTFPTRRLRLALLAYRLLWRLGLPLALAYLWRRGRADPLYSAHLGERFGRHAAVAPGAIWIHAVSLGEVRSAVPLARALLERGERIVFTHFTPAGRRECEAVFAAEIAEGRVHAVWVPFELGGAFRHFFAAFRPACGLVMEIEIWPEMIVAARRAGVALFMCNAQYPSKSYARDLSRTPVRADLMRGFAGAFVKSDLQRDRFASVGVGNIAVTGELRFAQTAPPAQIAAARAARARLAAGRRVLTFASVVAGEDALFLDAISALFAHHTGAGLPRPLIVYVPRAPERFDETARLLSERGFAHLRRSHAFDAGLSLVSATDDACVLLGDSLGEMSFYLEMADLAVVGGGFTPRGAHNIIEPLALGKPVIVGPETWTIEYPAEEAIAAGVCRRVAPEDLAAALLPGAFAVPAGDIDAFLADHAGAVEKTLDALPRLLAGAADAGQARGPSAPSRSPEST